jgi:hypothetical protein
MSELQRELEEVSGVRVSISTVWRSLKRAGANWKLVNCNRISKLKVTRHARERRERERRQFRDDMANFRPEQFVNLDESAYDRKTAGRSHGWAAKGKRANVRSFFIRGKRFTLEMAMSYRGALSYRIFLGSMDSMDFLEFLEDDLVFQ